MQHGLLGYKRVASYLPLFLSLAAFRIMLSFYAKFCNGPETTKPRFHGVDTKSQ